MKRVIRSYVNEFGSSSHSIILAFKKVPLDQITIISHNNKISTVSLSLLCKDPLKSDAKNSPTTFLSITSANAQVKHQVSLCALLKIYLGDGIARPSGDLADLN